LGSLLAKLYRTGRESRYWKGAVKLVQQLFVTLLVTYLLLLLVETIWEKSVSAYLNLNYWLIVLIVVGVVAVLTGPERREEEGRRLGRRDIAIVICAGLTGAAIVWDKTKEIGWLSYVISVISSGLIVLLFMLVWREKDEGEDFQGH